MAKAALNAVERKLGLPPQGRRPRPGRQARAGVGTLSTATPRRVLIVEDEALVALTLEAMVQDIGHVVTGTAANAREAVRLAVSTAPDIVLMDVRLGAAGDEGIAAAADVASRTSARIIFVTAYADQAMLGRINAGAPAAKVLAKPIDALELAQAIEEAMRGS